MNGWKESLKAGNDIEFLADWNGKYITDNTNVTQDLLPKVLDKILI